MTDRDSLPSTAAQPAVLDLIDRRKEETAEKAKRNGLRFGAGAAVFTATALLFPPAGLANLAATAAVFYGSWYGWDMLEQLSAVRSLNKAKKEAVEDPTLQKTAERADRAKKWFKLLSKTVLGLLGLTALAAVAVVAAPLSAVMITVPVFISTLAASLAVTVAQGAAKGSYKAAESVAEDGERARLRERRAALETEYAQLKSALAKTASPAASFGKAANDSAPQPGEDGKNPPVPAPAVLKP